MSDFDRDAAIKRVEKDMSLLFSHNMAFFKDRIPDIYNKFSDYHPQEIALRVSNSGYLNPVNVKHGNNPVYSKDPQEFCAEYMDEFIKSPRVFRLNFKKSDLLNEKDDVSLSTSNKIIEKINDKLAKLNKPEPLENLANYMLINGLGLGYIVSELLERIEVNHLVIIEPHADLFYYAMHLLDWQKVAEKFSSKNKSLQVIVGDKPDVAFEKVRINLSKIGPYCAGLTYVIDHLSSDEMKKSTELFFKSLPGYIASLGFLDDEIWSLAHTLENMKRDIPIMEKHSRTDSLSVQSPVFLIANGPSLDNHVDFLRKNREKAIYISCGTALSTLRRLGIKPDIHLEVERRKIKAEWLEATTDKEYRKDIRFVGINTLHPDSFRLFEKKYMAFKPNDLGTHFASQFIKEGTSIVALALCNPMVGNMGLAFVSAIGAKEAFIFGLDMAYSEEGEHHSKDSDYYKLKNSNSENVSRSVTLKGNFRSKVKSNSLFLLSSQVADACVRKFGSTTKFFNTSDGVLIDGAEPTPRDLLPDNLPDVDENIDLILERYFSSDCVEINDAEEYLKEHVNLAVTFLKNVKELYDQNFRTRDDVLEVLREQHRLLVNQGYSKEGQYNYTLMKGSFGFLGAILNIALHVDTYDLSNSEFFSEVLSLYKDFLERSILKIEREGVAVDKILSNISFDD